MKSPKSVPMRRSNKTNTKFSDVEIIGDLTDTYFNDGTDAIYMWVKN